MAIIHKLVESGAEAYLPFLLARERVIRRQRSDNADGSMSGGYAVKYGLGDGIEGELRMVGNQSFIRLSLSAPKTNDELWIAYPFSMALQYSAANSWGKVSFDPPYPEDPGPRPVREEIPYPTVNNRFSATDPTPADTPPPPPTGGCASEGIPLATASEWFNIQDHDTAAISSAAAAMILASGRDAAFLGRTFSLELIDGEYLNGGNALLGANDIAKTVTGSENFVVGNTCVTSYSRVFTWGGAISNLTSALAVARGMRQADDAWRAASEAAHAAWVAAYTVWEQKYTAWVNAQNGNPPDPAVCYPAFFDFSSITKATRDQQAAAIGGEIAIGVRSLPVFNGAMRPQYVPLEWPADEFVNGGPTPSWGMWTGRQGGAATYSTQAASITGTTIADQGACDGTSPGYSYVNVPARVSDKRTWGTTKRTYGFAITHSVRGEEMGMALPPPDNAIALSGSYSEWLASPRQKTDPVAGRSKSADFDLTMHKSGKLRVMFFEFYAYDGVQWAWVPSLKLRDISAGSDCITGYCTSVSRPGYGTGPPADGRYVRHMRVFAAKEYAFSPPKSAASSGDLDWTEWSAGHDLAVAGASALSLDLTGLNFDCSALPDGVAVLYGLDAWAMPYRPTLSYATTKEHVATARVPADALASFDVIELTEWLVKQATDKLTDATRS